MNTIKIAFLALAGAVGVNLYLEGVLKGEILQVSCIVFLFTAAISFWDIFENYLFLAILTTIDIVFTGYLLFITNESSYFSGSFVLFVLFLVISHTARVLDK